MVKKNRILHLLMSKYDIYSGLGTAQDVTYDLILRYVSKIFYLS